MNIDIRSEFPMIERNKEIIYFDNAATSLKPNSVIRAMSDYYENYGVSVHRGFYPVAARATQAYEESRNTISKFINSDSSEIIFTRGATEALNAACLMLAHDWGTENNEVILSILDHHSAMLPWLRMAQDKKCSVSFVPITDTCQISLEDLQGKITNKTRVLSINYSSNVTGTILCNIKEIVQLAHKNNVYVVVDATQAILHRPIDVKDLDCDFLAFSAHKMCGPTGVGVLYGKKELLSQLNPVFFGGEMVFNVKLNASASSFDLQLKDAPLKYEAGTPSVAEVIGLARAIGFINDIGGYEMINRIEERLTDYFYERVADFPEMILYPQNVQRDIPVFSFNLKGIHPHDAATLYGDEGVCVRAGNHCAQPLVESFGVSSTLRASLSFYNTKKEIDCFFKVTKNIIESLSGN